ncbi:LysR substrate-binding domain-containing protein [Pseudomonas sp. SGAir0191]|uniref:LysR substrate-binding domain-containing protein n=1 Tax=Pseudomonas TaxID=286 RepID=UPI000C2C89EF|nr:hypothetical protein CWR53_13370 [Pseudomonas sp. SGAir0191]
MEFSSLEARELDLALVTRRDSNPNAEILRCDRLHWVCAQHYPLPAQGSIPFALYPVGCGYREKILAALSRNGRRMEDL